MGVAPRDVTWRARGTFRTGLARESWQRRRRRRRQNLLDDFALRHGAPLLPSDTDEALARPVCGGRTRLEERILSSLAPARARPPPSSLSPSGTPVARQSPKLIRAAKSADAEWVDVFPV